MMEKQPKAARMIQSDGKKSFLIFLNDEDPMGMIAYRWFEYRKCVLLNIFFYISFLYWFIAGTYQRRCVEDKSKSA